MGSSRRDGNTGKLIDLIAGQLRTELIDLALKNISPTDTFEYLVIHYFRYTLRWFCPLGLQNSFDLLVAEKAAKYFVNKPNQTV